MGGVLCRLTGRKTRSVFERYNIVSECDLVEAAKKLNAMQPVRPTVRLKPDTTTTTRSKSATFDRDGLARRSAEGAKAGHNLGTVTRRSTSRRSVSL